MTNFLCSQKAVSVFIVSSLLCYQLRAQNYSVYNSFYVNPYLYNPAEAATDHAYGFANYRKQWLTVEGAPAVATLNLNTLIDNTRSGIGIKLSSYSRGLLNTSQALVTYAYGVPFNPNNVLFFGISGGASSNTIDISQVSNPNDPAITNYQSNSFQPSANFGMKWVSSSGVSLGAVLPSLIGPVYSPGAVSKTGMAPFDNMLFTFSFRKKMEGKLVNKTSRGVKVRSKSDDHYAPLELYGLYRYAAAGNNQFEVVGKLNLSDNFWLGLGYRQQYGLIASTGFAWDQFLVCYSYEPGGQPQKGFSTGSHELQIGYKLSKEKKFKFKVPQLRSTLKTETIRHDSRYHEKTIDDEEAARAEDKKRYYVYVKAFATFEQAEDFKKKLITQKYNSQIFFFPRNKQYYVYTFETTKLVEANEELKNLKTYTKLRDAKILTVIEK